jgi:DNA-binding MarR family transcriptional regulator
MSHLFNERDRERSPSAHLVEISGEDVAAANRLLKILSESSEFGLVRIAPRDRPRPLTKDELIEAAWREIERRGERMQVFPESMFSEVAWEMLLVLYAEHQRTRLTIGRLSEKLDVALTTALRWLNYLEDKHLVERHEHPTDQRSFFITLTETAIERLERYLSEAIARSP